MRGNQQVVTEWRNRGVQDIFIACVDGLKGFPEAIEAVFPKAVVQLCIVHMVRHSLNRGSFPSDEALTKLFYLALRNISQKWTMPIRDWKAALTRFTIQFGDRISVN